MKTSSRICLIQLSNERIVLFQMRQVALRSVISHQSVFVISVFITCNKTLLLGLVVGVISGGMLVTWWGSRRALHLPRTHTSNAVVASARGPDLRAPFHSWRDSRCWHTVFLHLCWSYQTSYYEVPHKCTQPCQFNHFPGVLPGKSTSDELPWNIKQTLVHDFSSYTVVPTG